MGTADLGGRLFSYQIKYHQRDGITNADPAQFSGKNVTPRYNGSIAEVDWRAVETAGVNPPLAPKRYGYAHDPLNRLTAGYYQNPDNPYSKENTESLSYDLNGNITGLYRTSVMEYGSNTATVIDNLNYTYIGNQATGINDASQNFAGYEGGGNTIAYDANGNMLSMPDKGINTIRYNFLNLPVYLNVNKFGNEDVTINTKYSADGTMLRKENTTVSTGFKGSTTIVKSTDYLDGFQYFSSRNITLPDGGFELMSDRAMQPQTFSVAERKAPMPSKTAGLQFFPTAEGFYDYQKDQYIYQHRDHLGNVRVSYGRNSSGALEIVDNNDYYPFGLNHLKSGTAFFGQGSYKNYKYNSKELQETGMYSYGWRDYMPDIGRWNGIDQLVEKYLSTGTYAYVANNPVSNADIDGRWFNDDGSIDTSGTANGFVRTRSYSQSYLGQYPGQGGGGGGYTFTGNAAASMFDYFANGGDINGISFNKGWATWSTLDNSNNFMYNDYDSMVTGFTGGVTLHRAKVSNDTSWDAYKNWADYGSGTIGTLFNAVADKRTDLYNKGYWIDNLGQMRITAYAGRAADSQIGLRSTYLRNTKMFAKYSKRAGYVGYAINAVQIGYWVYEDKGKFGKNAQVASAEAVTGIIVSAGVGSGATWLTGAIAGALGGSVAPGVGTVIGFIAGAVAGYYAGNYAGELVENTYK